MNNAEGGGLTFYADIWGKRVTGTGNSCKCTGSLKEHPWREGTTVRRNLAGAAGDEVIDESGWAEPCQIL